MEADVDKIKSLVDFIKCFTQLKKRNYLVNDPIFHNVGISSVQKQQCEAKCFNVVLKSNNYVQCPALTRTI